MLKDTRITWLVKNWINGNRKDVIDEILVQPVHLACRLSAELALVLADDTTDLDIFFRMLEGRTKQA